LALQPVRALSSGRLVIGGTSAEATLSSEGGLGPDISTGFPLTGNAADVPSGY